MSKNRIYALKFGAMCLSALLLILVFSTSYSRAKERCEYPNFFGPVMAPPERQLGEFRVELRRPAYDDRRSVQDHLVNSTIWARFLTSRLANTTWGGCSGAVSRSLFPDLRVFLHRGPPREGRDSSLNCAAILHGMLNSEPDAEEIKRIAKDEASSLFKSRSDPAGPTIDASNILRALLTKIYDASNVMHALVSVDYEAFQSFSIDNFQTWLRSQQPARTLQLMPLKFCGPEIDSSSAQATGAQQLPLSRTSPARAISYSIEKHSPILTRSLRHVVIVGQGPAVNFSRFDRPAMSRYCNKEQDIKLSATTVKVTTRCHRTILFEDSWVVFYCDPTHCKSEREAEAVINQIASDPDVLALAKDNLVAGEPRGPYVIKIGTEPPQ